MKTEILGRDRVLTQFAVFEFDDLGGVGDADLVQAVRGAHHQRRLGVQRAQRFGHQPLAGGGGDAQDLTARPGRIAQRPQQIEHGRHAQFLAHRHRVLHRRVVRGGEQEGDGDLAQTALVLLGAQIQRQTQRLQRVGAAAGAGGGAVAVLGQPPPRRRRRRRRRRWRR